MSLKQTSSWYGKSVCFDCLRLACPGNRNTIVRWQLNSIVILPEPDTEVLIVMSKSGCPCTAERKQYSLAKFLLVSLMVGSVIGMFAVNYNSIWRSVNEPAKYPKTYVVLQQYQQFWFVLAAISIVAGLILPRTFRNCMLILSVLAILAGLYNFLLPLGTL